MLFFVLHLQSKLFLFSMLPIVTQNIMDNIAYIFFVLSILLVGLYTRGNSIFKMDLSNEEAKEANGKMTQ